MENRSILNMDKSMNWKKKRLKWCLNNDFMVLIEGPLVFCFAPPNPEIFFLGHILWLEQWRGRNKHCRAAALPCPRARGQARCTPLSRRTGSRPSLSWSAAAPAPPCPSRGARGTRVAGGSAARWWRPGCGTARPGTPGRLVNSSAPSFLVTW